MTGFGRRNFGFLARADAGAIQQRTVAYALVGDLEVDTMKPLLWSWAAAMALAGSAPPQASTPSFAGSWRLVGQETSAFHGRASIGNAEAPVVIEQTATRLSVTSRSTDAAASFVYAIAPGDADEASPKGELWAVSRWEGATLVTRGRRLFSTPSGPEAFAFTERRRLSADGARMTVETRIEMFPRDLVRSSVYARADDRSDRK